MSKLPLDKFIKLMLFLNLFYTGFVLTIVKNSTCNIGLVGTIGLALGLNLLLNMFFTTINFWPHLIFGVRQTQIKTNSQPKPKEVSTDNPIRDLTAGINSPYLRPDAVGEDIVVDDKPSKLYELKDLIFDFDKRPHLLLVGESGSGKTHVLFNLIRLIKSQYQNTRFVLIDYGNQDFSVTYPTDLQTFLNVTQYMFYIMKGRQKEGRQNRSRIVWICEEFESVLAEVDLLPKKDKDSFYVQLANIGRMARKLDLNMIFVTQSAKADLFNTAIRNNFGFRFVMRLENSRLASSFGCNFSVGNLPTGVAWASPIDAFVQFEQSTEPQMDMIPYNDLRRLANIYKTKYNLEIVENV